jgi:hypothetical protein
MNPGDLAMGEARAARPQEIGRHQKATAFGD